jgi:TRAP-type C4-dicarboxylate transport system permease small subunit
MLDLMRLLERGARWLAYLGAAIVFVQVVWTSYGVMMRYVFDSPDAYVTEATALLLFPVAFLGLGYALKEDAYPRVSFLLDATRGHPSHCWLRGGTDLVMIVVGLFFSFASVQAVFKTYHSGAASEILLWPRLYFWIPSALAIVLFTLYAAVRWFLLWNESMNPDREN